MFDNWLGLESLASVTVAAAIGYYMWSNSEPASQSSSSKAASFQRKFTLDELALYNGHGSRLCYISVHGAVFDVSKDKAVYGPSGPQAHLAGSNTTELSVQDFESKYTRMGTLVLPRPFTLTQLTEFDGQGDKSVYLAVKGVVYDVTNSKQFYGPEGPYGLMAGRDASRALALMSLDEKDVTNNSIDDLSDGDLSQLQDWITKFDFKYQVVGYVVKDDGTTRQYPESESKAPGSATPAKTSTPPAAATATAPSFLNKKRQQVVLSSKTDITHDTRLFRFSLPDANMQLGLPTGKHVKIWCPNPTPSVEGEWNKQPDGEASKKEIERKYTPSSVGLGYFEMVIKVYEGGVVDRFPDGGKMSQFLDTVKIGETIDVAGPFGLIEYKGKGTFSIKRKDRNFKKVGMLAGGTGITPMLQLIDAVLADPDDETEVSLIFGNQTEDDILVRDMLEDLQSKHPDRFKLWYTLDRPPTDWKYSTGFITAEMIEEHLPGPSPDTLILMCGPPPMIKFACKANLDKLGFDKANTAEF